MGKRGYRNKGAEKPIYDGITFDSIDEVHFYIYLKTLKKNKLIEDFTFHPDSILVFPPYTEQIVETKQLKTKVKQVIKEKTVLHEATYTTDFIIKGLSDVMKPYFRISSDGTYWCDVKGHWSGSHGGDAKHFSFLVKALWYLKRIFVNKVVVRDLCAKTFVPDEIRYTKTGKESKIFKGCKTLKEFLK